MERRQYPYQMTPDQQARFGNLSDRLRRLGFWVSSEPLIGCEELWIDGISACLDKIEVRLAHVQRAYRCRGASKAALYYLHTSPRFDPGFGISVTSEQFDATAHYQKKLDRAVARFDEAFVE